MKKENKIIKCVGVLVLVTLSAVALYFYVGFFGNPVSKMLANHSAEKYVAQNYPDCYIENVGYNFKDGNYFANIQKEESIDTNFFVYFDWLGNFTYDSYESYVTKGHNTVNRMFMEYRALLDEIITPDNVDFTIDILYGDILTEYYGKDTSILPADEIIAMPMEEVVVDKQYDYTELGYKYGYVCLYACDEDVSVERACEILLDVKEKLDKSGVGFKYIDFVLQKPRQENGMPNPDESRINVNYFKWDEICAEDMVERVQTAHNNLTAHYAELNAQKTAEIKDIQG